MPVSITLTVSQLPTSTSFFLSCLQPLNYVFRGRVADTIGFGHPDAPPDFWITQSIPGVPPGPAHVAFPAKSRETVQKFYFAAVKAGGKVHGEPALRHEQSGYYSAAVIDFDGNSIEAVYRPDLMGHETRSRASDTKSVAPSMQKSQGSRKSTPSSQVSSGSRVKSAVSAAPKSSISKSPSQVSSVAASKVSSTPPSHARSKASSIVPDQIPSSPPPPLQVQPQQGDVVDKFLSGAQGTISMAKQLVNSAQPLVSPDRGQSESHTPSDTIVGTLLGVAAGAALHYAFSNRNKTSSSAPEEPHPGIARSETAPSYTDARHRYYHQQQQPRYAAIEAASSAYGGEGRRMIEMYDNDPGIPDYISTVKSPARRRSFSDYSATESQTSTVRPKKTLAAALPPSSYRGASAVTELDRRSLATRKSSSSRVSGSSSRRPSRREDEGYASATDTKSILKSGLSRRASSAGRGSTSRTSSKTRSGGHRDGKGESNGSDSSVLTAFKASEFNRKQPEAIPLPPSRATSQIDRPRTGRRTSADNSDYFSTHSRAHKTVIGRTSSSPKTSLPDGAGQGDTVPLRLTEKQLAKLSDGGRHVTRSVVGKIKDVDRLGVSRQEVKPDDSVSQVSSAKSRRR